MTSLINKIANQLYNYLYELITILITMFDFLASLVIYPTHSLFIQLRYEISITWST